MANAETILVIILSTTLAIFLVLGIIALVKINHILDHVNKITEKAEKLADQAEHVGDFLKNTTTSAAITKIVASAISGFKRTKGQDDNE
jgi:hypothetical protein